MTLLYKPDMVPYEIYDIHYDVCGYPTFLIYRQNQWVQISAKHFTPKFCSDGSGGYMLCEIV